MPDIEIFRAGTRPDMYGRTVTIGPADLVACAAAYDPKAGEAPLVVGHPAANHPAYGWVESLSVQGDILTAKTRQVEASFADLVNTGRFKKVSASFYDPRQPNNPKPGTWYLRHVGFLGAAVPAVPGLKQVAFADAGEGVVMFAEEHAHDLREWNFAQREHLLEEREAAARRADYQLMAGKLTAQGKLLPRQHALFVSFMEALDGGNGIVAFADQDQTIQCSRKDAFLKFFADMPRVLPPMGEVAGSDRQPPAEASFCAPEGYSVDAAALEMHQRAEAWRQTHPGTSYRDAVIAVAKTP